MQSQFVIIREIRVSLPHQLLFKIADDLADVCIHFHAVFDQSARVENSAVITATESIPDGGKRGLSHLTGEEHRDLARERDAFRTALARHVGQTNVEMLGNSLLDEFDADGMAALFVEDLAEQAFND